MGIFKELYIYPCQDEDDDGFPDELVITNGKRTMAYVPERTCVAERHDCGDGVTGLYCSGCGNYIDENDNYCPSCGAKVVE